MYRYPIALMGCLLGAVKGGHVYNGSVAFADNTSFRLLEEDAATPAWYAGEEAVSVVNLAGSFVTAINDPSMKNIGELLVSASPVLTLLPPPHGALIGFVLLSGGTLLSAWGDSEQTPSNADVLSEMNREFANLRKHIDSRLQNIERDVGLIFTETIKEKLGFNMLGEIDKDYLDARELHEGHSAPFTVDLLRRRVAGTYEQYGREVHGTGALSSQTLRQTISFGINEQLNGPTPDFCQAAGYVRDFVIARHRLLWLEMMQVSFEWDGHDMVYGLNRTVTEFTEDMESYESTVRSFGGDDLFRAIASSRGRCEQERFGINCNAGQPKFNDDGVMGGCQCDGKWQGKVTVAKSDDPRQQPASFSESDDEAIQHECYVEPPSCDDGIDGVRVVSVGTRLPIAVQIGWFSSWLQADGGSNDQWEIRAADGAQVYIYNKAREVFLRDNGGDLEFESTAAASKERWTIEWAGQFAQNDGGALTNLSRLAYENVTAVRFRSHSDYYLTVNQDDYTVGLSSKEDKSGWRDFDIYDTTSDLPCRPRFKFIAKERMPSDVEFRQMAGIADHTTMISEPAI